MATIRQDALRLWGLGTLAVLLSAAAAFSYLFCMANGIGAGDLIGLKGREQDVLAAQRWARFWFTASVCCLGMSTLAGAFATRVYAEASWFSRIVARTVVAATVSFALAVLIGLVTFSIITGSRHSVVH
jgi:hypothetical protein